VPQLPQNASPGSTFSPQLGQRPGPAAGPDRIAGPAATPVSDVPQLSQKAAPAGACAPQFGQVIVFIVLTPLNSARLWAGAPRH
jgi:hypothetical protein